MRLFLPTAAAVNVCVAAFVFAGALQAEEFKLGENPVSVIMKWRPTTADPEVQDFVKSSRPDERSLAYTPLSGAKADRPKLKSAAELKTSVQVLDAKAATLRARGAAVGANDGGAVARKLKAAAAESRRRAADDFASQ